MACLTRPSRSASPGWVTFCVRCNQLQPLSVQLRCLDAQPNRSQRARNARSNGEEMRLNRQLARRPAPSTARRHLIHQLHSCARRCATTLLKGVKTAWTTRGDQVLNRWAFIFAELIHFLGQMMHSKLQKPSMGSIRPHNQKKGYMYTALSIYTAVYTYTAICVYCIATRDFRTSDVRKRARHIAPASRARASLEHAWFT